MSVSEWKNVILYSVTTCPNYQKGQTKADITAVCYNAKQRIFCDAAGCINVYFKNWKPISFRATSSAIILCQLTPSDSNYLVTLSQGKSADSWLLMVFNLDKINKRTGAPCEGVASLTTNSTPTALAAHMLETQMYISVGCQKGDIWLCRAPLSRDMSANFKCKAITSWPINGISFHHANNALNMFVCSNGGIFLYTITDSNSLLENKVILDGSVSPARCCALLSSFNDPYFVVGRDDALYCFTSDGRGPCYAVEGIKSHIAALRKNLVVVLKNNNNDTDTIVIVDTTNKIIMLSTQIRCVKSVMIDKNECYVLTENGDDLFLIRELDLDNKLRKLCKKNLYDVALRFVDNSDENEPNELAIANINLNYGHNLLLKGDLNKAIEKYIQTLGYIDPYNIIQKLMDSRYTKYLTQYLNALVSKNLAEPEHIELLHNCNERLYLPTKLHIMHPHLMFNTYDENYENNVQCIKIAGIRLNNFLKTLTNAPADLEDIFAHASEEQIYDFFLEHGQYLLAQHPNETIQILKKLCDYATEKVRKPERFLAFLIFDEAQCIDFLEHITGKGRECSISLNNTLFELRLRAWKKSPHTISLVDLLDFLKDREEFMSYNQALILCRVYCFWPGLKYLVNKTIKNPNSVVDSGPTKEKSGYTKMLKSFNNDQSPLHGDGIGRSSHLFANLLNDMLDDKNQSILQILNNLCNNRNVLVKNVKEFFSQEHFCKNINYLQQEKDKVNQMLQTKEKLQNLLEQYLQQPIEFRSSICDICKKQLKPPSIYFLCQHFFHKECLAAYAERESCVACISNKKQPQAVYPELSDLNLDSYKTNDEDSITTYTDMLYRGIFNHARSGSLLPKKEMVAEAPKPSVNPNELSKIYLSGRSNEWSGRYNIDSVKSKTLPAAAPNPFEITVKPQQNPFEDYDNNLNPFND